MISAAAREYTTEHFTAGVAEYLLGADGFRTAPGNTPGLAAEWQSILAELAQAGHMRRSQTGRYWWAGEDTDLVTRARD